MAPPPDVRLAAAYLTRYNRLRTRTAATVGVLWDRLADLDDQAADRFRSEAAATVRAAQDATTVLVNGYITTTAAMARATLDLDDTPPNPRGVEAEDVYQRGIVTARTVISEGRPYMDALAAGRARSVTAAATDVALVQRDVMTRAVGRAGIVGYRRVLTGKSCPLCQIASTQRYHAGQLMPIHGSCDCGVAPIIGSRDPGQVVNNELLADLKRRGEVDRITKARALPKAKTALENAEKRIAELRRDITSGALDQERETRLEKRLDKWLQTADKRRERVELLSKPPRTPKVQIHEHGELGPVLTDSRHGFTSEAAFAT